MTRVLIDWFYIAASSNKFGRTSSLAPKHPMPIGNQKRLSFPTPGALKQSGMPPLPPPHSSKPPMSLNNSSMLMKTTTSAGIAPNGYSSAPLSSGCSPHVGPAFHHYRNQPTQNSSRGISLTGNPMQSSNGGPSSNAIIGGIPVNNLIPPPPPPSSQPGPAFTGRFFNKKFYPQS